MTPEPSSTPRRRVSVHALGQFVFCERAGVMADASDAPDRVEDIAALDYLPKYELHAIERELGKRSTWLAVGGVLTLLSFVSVIALRPWLGAPVTWWSVGGMLGFGGLSLWTLSSVLTLAERLRAARQAAAASPPDQLDTEFPVHWWRLLADGWESSVCQEPYLDENLELVGSPWRVLRRGNLRVPVIRSTDDDQIVRTKHRVRLAAYCSLLQACEGGESPYGVVIFAGEYDGIAIPVSERNHGWIERVLDRLRERVQRPENAAEPVSFTRCGGCPFAVPRPYVAGQSETVTAEGEVVPPFPTRDRHAAWRHSDCGDRYRWTPPHNRASVLGMLEPTRSSG